MKKRRPREFLTHEDRHLWTQVAQTTEPLSRDRGDFLKEEMARLMEHSAPAGAPKELPVLSKPLAQSTKSLPLQSPSQDISETHPLEDRLIKHLAKGRRNIDGRIDLHGMTQDRARKALFEFLQSSQRYDRRIVLVITGKGDEGRGVLRRMVPQWLSLPAFLPLVNGWREAHIGHGGEGALYVRLRRKRK